MTAYVVFQESLQDTAERVRLSLSGLLPDTGDLQSRSGLLDDGGVVTLAGGMAASVSPFRCYIHGVSGATQGGYLCVLDDDLVVTFADGSGTNRTDLVVARVYDDIYDSDGFDKFAVEIVEGTPGGGVPVTPPNAIKLAEKVITGSMSAGTGGLGTAPVDKRPARLAANGGVVPVADATDRATLNAYEGLTVARLDLKRLERYLGGAWKPVGLDAPAVKVERHAAQALVNEAETAIIFDTEIYDTHGMYSGAGANITIPEDGSYQVTGRVSIDTAVGGLYQVQVNKNGALAQGEVLFRGDVDASNAPTTRGGVSEIECVAGDVLTLVAFQITGANRNTRVQAGYYPQFIVRRVR